MLGRAAIVMWWEYPPEMRPEIEDWHSHEHFPERLGIPGFLRGSRWADAAGKPAYFIAYEAARLATITSGPYLERLNNPTPWSRKMMPHHLHMVRSLTRVRASFGGGLGQALATVRFSPRRGVTKRLMEEVLPALATRKGLTGAHLLQSAPMPSAQTAEQKIRGGDASADWVLLVNGYDGGAVESFVASELSIPDAVTGFYRLSYTAVAKDFA